VVIKTKGEEITNQSYWKAILNGEIISLGRHEDTFEKREGRWYFKNRTIYKTWAK